jgi:hypothetical protein
MGYLKTFIVACIGGWIFSLVHMPLPWTLGPLAIIAAWQAGFDRPAVWSSRIRNIGMIVLGYVMGRPFDSQAGSFILSQLPAMIILTLLTIALSLAGGYIISRYTGVGLASSLLGSMPGGLSQMTLLSREIRGADAAEVTLMQTVRMVTVVFVVPFIVLHFLADQVTAVVRQPVAVNINQLPMLAVFATVIAALLYLTKHINLPGRYASAPVVGTAALVLAGFDAPALPSVVVALAQICVSIRMGMEINVASLTNWKRLFSYNFTSILSVIGLLAAADYLFAKAENIPFVTAFISTAPGGMTEMGLTAMMINADLSTVIAFQLFRLLFVLTVGIPVLKWWLGKK